MLRRRLPDFQKKTQQEVDEVVGRDRYPAIADKPAMPYVNALIQEILRYGNISTLEPHMGKLLLLAAR